MKLSILYSSIVFFSLNHLVSFSQNDKNLEQIQLRNLSVQQQTDSKQTKSQISLEEKVIQYFREIESIDNVFEKYPDCPRPINIECCNDESDKYYSELFEWIRQNPKKFPKFNKLLNYQNPKSYKK